ncbi:A24 family peptidase [Metapseudomonas furukawaii]|uniref:A24 family peptidase n=1 Tax=Metapseudomonas furukawaii TaxID=1149133 RepID=UPI0040463445
MNIEVWMMNVVLLSLLTLALVSDLVHQRIPNRLILVGVGLGLIGQMMVGGVGGVLNGLSGMLIGFAVFIPLYALGGMAAGDVKLIAMVGSFLAPFSALWTALLCLVAGGLFGLLLVVGHGQSLQTLKRYWLMLKLRTLIRPDEGEVAGKPFPYAVAILLGTSASLLWLPVKG